MQYEHEDIFDLLVQVYAADQNLRDWSGRKPRQYRTNCDTCVSADTFRSKSDENASGPLRFSKYNSSVRQGEGRKCKTGRDQVLMKML
ncbi:hypothetical protein RUM44_009876 [Polyplax serrata]|uniref:Uncharacterized protein n=1 Tax=Polyplax serrata TaxID=468196 RepID=A0ABR1ATY6_POLSC